MIDPSAFVHPTAVLIGDVIIGAGVYVGPLASLRGDFGRIEVHAGANIQDGCVMHGFPEAITCVEEDGHVGHGAVLHGCTVRRDALIGMKAVVMDDAVIGAAAIVAAGAVVPAGMHVAPRSLVAGLPAKFVRLLDDREVAWKHRGTLGYQELTRRCLASLVEVRALEALDANRPRLQASSIKTLGASRRDS